MTDDPNYIPRREFRPGWGNVTYCDRESFEIVHQIVSYSPIVTIPIDFIGIYFIIWKSPKEMTSYKWFLLAHQIFTLLFDLFASLLCIPEFTFPIWGLKVHGILGHSFIPIQIYGVFGLGVLGGVVGSIIALFYYRAQIIIPAHHIFHHSYRQKAIFYVITFTVNVIIPVHYMAFIPVNQEPAKRDWFEKRICVPNFYFDDDTYIFYYGPEKYYFYFLLYYMVVLVSLWCLIALLPTYYLIKETNNMSESTRKIQKMFLISLSIQVTVPLLLVMSPIFVFLHVRHWYFERQFVNNFMLLFVMVHGSSETLLMLFATVPYRNIILRKQPQSAPSSISSSSSSPTTLLK